MKRESSLHQEAGLIDPLDPRLSATLHLAQQQTQGLCLPSSQNHPRETSCCARRREEPQRGVSRGSWTQKGTRCTSVHEKFQNRPHELCDGVRTRPPGQQPGGGEDGLGELSLSALHAGGAAVCSRLFTGLMRVKHPERIRKSLRLSSKTGDPVKKRAKDRSCSHLSAFAFAVVSTWNTLSPRLALALLPNLFRGLCFLSPQPPSPTLLTSRALRATCLPFHQSFCTLGGG